MLICGLFFLTRVTRSLWMLLLHPNGDLVLDNGLPVDVTRRHGRRTTQPQIRRRVDSYTGTPEYTVATAATNVFEFHYMHCRFDHHV
jgi:hypothetical protein